MPLPTKKYAEEGNTHFEADRAYGVYILDKRGERRSKTGSNSLWVNASANIRHSFSERCFLCHTGCVRLSVEKSGGFCTLITAVSSAITSRKGDDRFRRVISRPFVFNFFTLDGGK